MPLIELQTTINSTIEVCFDLSRSIDLHKISTAKTGEEAIDGVTSGLIGPNEFVTWRARHFGVIQKLTTKITMYDRPRHFRDEQIRGAFKRMIHDHYFEKVQEAVLMTDRFYFESPFGLIGHAFNRIVLTNYLRRFLIERNETIKEYSETGKWQKLLP